MIRYWTMICFTDNISCLQIWISINFDRFASPWLQRNDVSWKKKQGLRCVRLQISIWIWCGHGYHVDMHMVIRWISYGYHMDVSWNHMDIIRISYGYHIDRYHMAFWWVGGGPVNNTCIVSWAKHLYKRIFEVMEGVSGWWGSIYWAWGDF